MQIIIFTIISLALFLTAPKTALFYDAPEYLRIVANNSFLQVFSLGHPPIHPIFMGILWLTTRIVSGNETAILFGLISLFLIYKVSRILFKNNLFWLVPVIFVLFPGVWIISTNLMVESILLTFYLLAFYFLLKRQPFWFFVSVFLSVSAHIQAVFWLPTIFLTPFMFEKEIKFGRKEFIKFAKLAVLAVFLSVGFYALILSDNLIFNFLDRSGELWNFNDIYSYLRIIRNVWVSFTASFGSLTLFVLAFLLVKNIRHKKLWIAWMAFFTFVAFNGSIWEGDFMARRIVFAGVVLSLAIYKYLRKKSIFVILYLVPIIAANGLLYFRYSPQKEETKFPAEEVLVQTRYLEPFTKYDGVILWVGVSDLNKIDDYLRQGKRVFMDRQALTAPYMLFVGNNYHITSLGRVGDSESRILFTKYAFSKYGDNLELKMVDNNKISSQAGEPVIFYDNSFWGRLRRERIDYGDIGTWVWAIATNRRDPAGWTYKDASGAWVYPEDSVK